MSVGENMCSTYQKTSLVMLKHGENMLQLKKHGAQKRMTVVTYKLNN